ncbi:MAG: tetratricopeptide repeat protein, partial [Pseudomonadota bacterium]
VAAANFLAIAHGRLDEHAEAEKVLLKALEIEPNSVPVLLNLANTQARSRKFDKAIENLERVLAVQPNNVKALGMITSLELTLQRPERTRERVNNVLANEPDPSAELLLLDARVKRSFGEFSAAAEVFKRLIERHGSRIEWRRDLARSYFQAEQNQQAIQVLTEITATNDARPSDFIQLAQVYEAARDRRGAKEAVRDALDLSPAYPLARLLDVKYLLFDQEVTVARERFDKLMADSPNRELPELMSVEGAILMLEGKVVESITRFERVYELEPTGQRAIDVAKAYASNGQPNKALNVLETRLNNNPQENNVKFVLADAHWKTGSTQKAVEHYRELLANQPSNPIILNNLAAVLTESAPAQALEYIERAYEQAPNAPSVLDTYAGLLISQNQFDRAKQMINKALEIAPGDNSVLFRNLQLLIQLGEYRAAEPIFKKIDAAELTDDQRAQLKTIAQALD